MCGTNDKVSAHCAISWVCTLAAHSHAFASTPAHPLVLLERPAAPARKAAAGTADLPLPPPPPPGSQAFLPMAAPPLLLLMGCLNVEDRDRYSEGALARGSLPAVGSAGWLIVMKCARVKQRDVNVLKCHAQKNHVHSTWHLLLPGASCSTAHTD